MENLVENIVGGILTAAPIILLLVKFFAAEYVTTFTKELFKSKTNKKANLIFNGIVVFSLIVGIFVILYPYISSGNHITPNVEQQQNAPQKNDEELIFEGSKILYEEGKEIIKNKKERDNTIKANREKKLVYQIGSIKGNDKAVLNLYKRLKNIHSLNSSRIFVFEISRNKYLVYKDDGYSQDQIIDSLANFKSQIDSIEPYVKIVDLMEYCKVKEKFLETKSLKFKKQKIEISCFNCGR